MTGVAFFPLLCPCHSSWEYANCCKRYHLGAALPEPVALMRSRYSAYALQLVDYVVETTHPNQRPQGRGLAAWKQSILLFATKTRFVGLEILEDSLLGDEAFVTFIAQLREQERDASFKERSRFQRLEGRWFYLDGQITSLPQPSG